MPSHCSRASRDRRARRAWFAAILLLATGRSLAQPSPATQPLLPPLATQPGDDLPSQDVLVVRRFEFDGNTRFADAELDALVREYRDKPITVEKLEDARILITRKYVEAGYINSGAILPDQTIADAANATITFRIIEGKLTEVRIADADKLRLRQSYLEKRIRYRSGPPFDVNQLRDQLELIRQDPNVRSINAELRPGLAPGESLLDVQVQENNPWQLGAVYSNRRPPSVGSTALDLYASHRNLTGNGDLLAVRWDVFNGPIDEPEFADLEDFSIDYTIPIHPSDTTVTFSYARSDSLVVETPFEDLDIQSKSDTFAVTVRQPLWRRPIAEPATDTTPARPAIEVATFFTGSVRDNRSTLLGAPFDFADGSDRGEYTVASIRFGQEFTSRSERAALSLRSTFSFGIDAFGATTHGGSIPDSHFVTWLGQAHYVRRLGDSDTQLVLRGATQLSSSPLLATEQFAVGGFDTVRGYRENSFVRDMGVTGTMEFRIPLITGAPGEPVLTIVPFFDFGFAWNKGEAGSAELASIGVGLVWTPNPQVTAQIYIGAPLTKQPDEHDDLQDLGIHFSFSVFAW